MGGDFRPNTKQNKKQLKENRTLCLSKRLEDLDVPERCGGKHVAGLRGSALPLRLAARVLQPADGLADD